jgi:hypothetical protein
MSSKSKRSTLTSRKKKRDSARNRHESDEVNEDSQRPDDESMDSVEREMTLKDRQEVINTNIQAET